MNKKDDASTTQIKTSLVEIQNDLSFATDSRFPDWLLVVEGSTDKRLFEKNISFIEIRPEKEIIGDINDTDFKKKLKKFGVRSREKIICIVLEKYRVNKHFYGIIDEDYHKLDRKQLEEEINASQKELDGLFKKYIKYTEPNSLETMMVNDSRAIPFYQVLNNTSIFQNMNKTVLEEALDNAYFIGRIRNYMDSIEYDSYNHLLRVLVTNLGKINIYELLIRVSFRDLQEEKHYSDFYIQNPYNNTYIFDKQQYYIEFEKKLETRYNKAQKYLDDIKNEEKIDNYLYNSLKFNLLLRKNEIKFQIQQILKSTSQKIDLALCQGHDIIDLIVSKEAKTSQNPHKEINLYLTNSKNSELENCIIDEYAKTNNFKNSNIYNWLKEIDNEKYNDFKEQIYVSSSRIDSYSVIFIHRLNQNNSDKHWYIIFGITSEGKRTVLSINRNNNFNDSQEDFHTWFKIMKDNGIKNIKTFKTYLDDDISKNIYEAFNKEYHMKKEDLLSYIESPWDFFRARFLELYGESEMNEENFFDSIFKLISKLEDYPEWTTPVQLR